MLSSISGISASHGRMLCFVRTFTLNCFPRNILASNWGKMVNSDANQLPEVDSLPDGFVEGSTEPLAPPTPTVEQEKPRGDYKEGSFSEIDHSDELAANEFQTSPGSEEKTQKLRTFPVPLSETDSFDVSEQTQGSQGSQDASTVPEASDGVVRCSKVKEQVQADCQSSERCNYLYFVIFLFLFSLLSNELIFSCGELHRRLLL